MSSAAAAAKYVPTVAGVALADITIGGIDLRIAGAIIIGLVGGAVLKSSKHIEDGTGWSGVGRDLLVSAMGGIANFIIAGITVAVGTLAVPGFPLLAAAGVGLFFGYQGPNAIRWFNRRFFGQGEPMPRRGPSRFVDYANEPGAEPNEELIALAHRLDEPEG